MRLLVSSRPPSTPSTIDIDVRWDFYATVVLSGGTKMYKDLPESMNRLGLRLFVLFVFNVAAVNLKTGWVFFH